MFIHKTPIEQIAEERRKIESTLAKLTKAIADMEYIAMMTDVDINDEPAIERIGDDNE